VDEAPPEASAQDAVREATVGFSRDPARLGLSREETRRPQASAKQRRAPSRTSCHLRPLNLVAVWRSMSASVSVNDDLSWRFC